MNHFTTKMTNKTYYYTCNNYGVCEIYVRDLGKNTITLLSTRSSEEEAELYLEAIYYADLKEYKQASRLHRKEINRIRKDSERFQKLYFKCFDQHHQLIRPWNRDDCRNLLNYLHNKKYGDIESGLLNADPITELYREVFN